MCYLYLILHIKNTNTYKVSYLSHLRSGIILNNHYVHASCSPSRAALLTGRYAWKTGMQRGNIEKFQPLGRSGDSSVQVS